MKKPMPADTALAKEVRREEARDLYLESLDEPRHVLEYGGINGEATIKGMPTGSDRPGESFIRSQKLGIYTEPVPVMMRDAVSIDTAVRLTGINRQTLQVAARRGALPVLKLGPDSAPYVLRLRDVITYLVTMYTEQKARQESPVGDMYLGFPEWLVSNLSDAWPDNRKFTPGQWEAKRVNRNRGGRPRGYSPGKGFSKTTGVKLGRPPKIQAEEKQTPPEGNHPQAAVQDTPVAEIDPTTLPKWHPQWRRPGS
jgi:hypothetical protein